MAMKSYWGTDINFAFEVASNSYACSSLIMGNMGETDLSNDPEGYFLEDEDEFFKILGKSFDSYKDVLAHDSDDEPLELHEYGAIIVSLNEMQKRTREILEKVGFKTFGPIPQGKNYTWDEDESRYHDIYIMIVSANDLAEKLAKWNAKNGKAIED